MKLHGSCLVGAGSWVAYVEGAERRLHLVPSLSEGRTAVAGLILLREAIALLARAYVTSHRLIEDADDGELDSLRLAERLGHILESAPSAPDGWRGGVQALWTDDPLYFDRLGEDELRSLAAAWKGMASWLRSRVETRSIAYTRATRWGRRGALVIASILLVRVLVTCAESWAHPNFALHKPVTQSSSWSGSAPPDALVDGETFGSRGPEVAHCNVVHTNMEASPWVMIDLQAVRLVQEVRVYNRVDHHLDAGLPYVLETSEDGSLFETVARRTTHFGATSFDPPWKVAIGAKRVRFVRIRCEHFLALSEVEVF